MIKEDNNMKKIYCSPEIRLINLRIEELMQLTTDSIGLKRSFKSREFTFEEEEEVSTPPAVNIWGE